MANVSNNDIAQAIFLSLKDKSGNDFNNTLANVVHFLNQKRLLSKSKEILLKLKKIINDSNGILEAKISSAKTLSEKEKMNLANFLKNRYKAKGIFFDEFLNEKLLGGVKVEVNNEIIDNTVQNKFKKLQEYLTRKI